MNSNSSSAAGLIKWKVEVNHVFRGTIQPMEKRRLGSEARNLFTTDLTVPVLAAPELYGSKLVAAMDRQHPRDYFDVRGLFQRGGLTGDVVECFVCYLAGHNRPVHEVLFSRDQDMKMAFENEFVYGTKLVSTLQLILLWRIESPQWLGLPFQPRFQLFIAHAHCISVRITACSKCEFPACFCLEMPSEPAYCPQNCNRVNKKCA